MKNNKKIKWSDIICIAIGACMLIYGIVYSFNVENTLQNYDKLGMRYKTGYTKAQYDEKTSRTSNILLIGGFGITAFGMACVIKRKLDKKDEEKTEIKNNDNDTTTKLKDLKKMLDDKIITEKEFQEKKKELLKKM